MAVKIVLKLYITGQTNNSQEAIENLRKILEEKTGSLYTLEVIDVLVHPEMAKEDKILATPTLLKILPPPIRKIIGDLSNKEKVLWSLDLPSKGR